MPRRSVLKVVKVNYTPNAPWMVRVPARLQAMEGSQKKFFERESVAKAYAERLARQLGEYHTQALGLTDRQKMEAAECYRLLAKENASMLEAVQYYLIYLAQAKQSVPIRQLFEEFLAAKRQDGLSSKYLADLRSKLGRFGVAFSDTLACNLSAPMLEAWLRGLKVGSVSRESYRRNISVMLEFGRRRGALRANPAADIKITRRPEGEVTILSLVEVARLLERCAPELVSYVAICAFAGLRPSEAEALDWQTFTSIRCRSRSRRGTRRPAATAWCPCSRTLWRGSSRRGVTAGRSATRGGNSGTLTKLRGSSGGRQTCCATLSARIVCRS